jgi:Flp pilus assembly protein TadD
MRLLTLALVPLLAATPALAQSVQYRSAAGVEYRSFADTGAIARARAALDADPRNVQRYLELGAAQSAARQFREAIDTYTRGIAVDSTNAMLYRWRGHRYLSVRDMTRAMSDLQRALAIDSTNYGALYHLGIIHFAHANFGEAANLFARAQRNPPNAGELAGSTDWLWMSLMRAGRAAEATAMLARRPDSLPIENAYRTRLRLYRGELEVDRAMTPADTADTQAATLGYGIGNWYLVRGDSVRARDWFARAVRSGGWPAFGFIVAEAELRRMGVTAMPGQARPEVQERGTAVMGVDQYASRHRFDSFSNGGLVVLEVENASDTAAIAAIRNHMRGIASDFRAGHFDKPFQVHARRVPGTDVMAARSRLITYIASDLPRGAQLQILSRDPQAIRAIHDFLAFQRMDHSASGHVHPPAR